MYRFSEPKIGEKEGGGGGAFTLSREGLVLPKKRGGGVQSRTICTLLPGAGARLFCGLDRGEERGGKTGEQNRERVTTQAVFRRSRNPRDRASLRSCNAGEKGGKKGASSEMWHKLKKEGGQGSALKRVRDLRKGKHLLPIRRRNHQEKIRGP